MALPLAIDLDGTLIAGDSSMMSIVGLLKKSPIIGLCLLPLFVIHRARFKHEVAKRYVPDVTTFDYNQPLLSFIKSERVQGRVVILATASNIATAESVAAHLGCFDGVIASDKNTYRGGRGKAAALVERFGKKGFVYAGNEVRDLPVWEAASAAILVNVPAPFAVMCHNQFVIEREF